MFGRFLSCPLTAPSEPESARNARRLTEGGRTPVDYAIVTRMVDTTTDRPVIIAAGLTHYGTTGAGEFLNNRNISLRRSGFCPETGKGRACKLF